MQPITDSQIQVTDSQIQAVLNNAERKPVSLEILSQILKVTEDQLFHVVAIYYVDWAGAFSFDYPVQRIHNQFFVDHDVFLHWWHHVATDEMKSDKAPENLIAAVLTLCDSLPVYTGDESDRVQLHALCKGLPLTATQVQNLEMEFLGSLTGPDFGPVVGVHNGDLVLSRKAFHRWFQRYRPDLWDAIQRPS